MQHSEITQDGVTWPTSFMALAPSERLIVWAFRRWVLGLRRNDGAQWTIVGKEFSRQFDRHDGTIALAGFARLIDGLQRRARRVMHIHQVCCPCLSADEVCLVALVAACQAPVPSAARARAEWLVRGDGVGDLLDAGTRLACLMLRHGLSLPQRSQAKIPVRDTAPEAVILH